MVKPTPRRADSTFQQIAPGGMGAQRGLPNQKDPKMPAGKDIPGNTALAGLNKAISRVGKRKFGSFA